MNVLIIEDEALTARRLESLLLKYDSTIQVLARIPSVADAVAWFQDTKNPAIDLIFMDIHLEDDLGFRIFEQVKLTTPVVFTTAYDEYMIQAFKVNSIDYLLKPINYDELVVAIEKFKALRIQFAGTTIQPAPDLSALMALLGKPATPDYKDRFMITVGTRIRTIETREVAYFFLEEKITFLVTNDGTTLPVDYSLDKLTQVLDPRRFFRISRQFLIELGAIRQIHAFSAGKLKLDLHPKSRHEIFVSGDRMAEFKEWLGK
jgi:DNA-binding LytR/AlgR family response regulator